MSPWRRVAIVLFAGAAVAFMVAPESLATPNSRNLGAHRSRTSAPRTPTPAAATATAQGAVISNGTVMLGVNKSGDLNYDCQSAGDPACPAASLQSESVVGLRYVPNNAEGTADGCPCEGWGAADFASGLAGWANQDESPQSTNLTIDTFTSSSSSARSTVTISDPSIANKKMQVVQNYQPAPTTPNLYQDTVTITNTGSTALADVRYRRVMDWDVEPTAFSEWVTIQGATKSSHLLFDSDDGFETANPIAAGSRTYIDSESACGPNYSGSCDVVDLGSGGTYPTVSNPDDHGALFDFGFGSLTPGQAVTFSIFYGAAPSETDAKSAVGKVGAEVYSLGESNCPETTGPGGCNSASLPPHAGVEQGKPVTFVFAFSGVGGTAIQTCEPPTKVGTSASDRLTGTTAADKIEGLGGRDYIAGLGGDDELCGNTYGDFVYGGAGNDNLQGGGGNDRLFGGGGNDIINGGPGHDAIFAGTGTNSIVANDGVKDCIIASSTDVVSLDPGLDLVNPTGAATRGCPAGFWRAGPS